MNTAKRGTYGEMDAEAYLIANGYTVLKRNYRRGGGEIDIIALDRDTVVIVEVKSRTGARFGRPAESVTAAKRKNIAKTTLYFLKEAHMLDFHVRFDVIEILPGSVKHIKSAFDATGMF